MNEFVRWIFEDPLFIVLYQKARDYKSNVMMG
ncbi:Uncharacterised protein [Pragia fontium]|nr:Uncharacterised protein [Pragia fontium]